jgi:hypothetical protein
MQNFHEIDSKKRAEEVQEAIRLANEKRERYRIAHWYLKDRSADYVMSLAVDMLERIYHEQPRQFENDRRWVAMEEDRKAQFKPADKSSRQVSSFDDEGIACDFEVK